MGVEQPDIGIEKYTATAVIVTGNTMGETTTDELGEPGSPVEAPRVENR